DETSQEEVTCGYDSLTACSSDGGFLYEISCGSGFAHPKPCGKGRHCQTINGMKAECKDD
ncbi:801_t:CDS:1, partial [Funneliformis caledonium]